MKTLFDILIGRENLKDYQISLLKHYRDILENVDIEVLDLDTNTITAHDYLKALLNPEFISIKSGPELSLIQGKVDQFFNDIKHSEHILATEASADNPLKSIFIIHNKNKDLLSIFVIEHFISGFYFQNNYNKAFYNTHLFIDKLLPVCCEQYLLNNQLANSLQKRFIPFVNPEEFNAKKQRTTEFINNKLKHSLTTKSLDILRHNDYTQCSGISQTINVMENYSDNKEFLKFINSRKKLNFSYFLEKDLDWIFGSFDRQEFQDVFSKCFNEALYVDNPHKVHNLAIDKFIDFSSKNIFEKEGKGATVIQFISIIGMICASPILGSMLLSKKYKENQLNTYIEAKIQNYFSDIISKPQDVLFMGLIKYYKMFNPDRQMRIRDFISNVEEKPLAQQLKLQLRSEDKSIVEKNTLSHLVAEPHIEHKKKILHKL